MAAITKNNDENQHSVQGTRKSVKPLLSDITNRQETHGERDQGRYKTEDAPTLKKPQTQHTVKRKRKSRQKRSPCKSASSESSAGEAPSSRSGVGSPDASAPGSPDTESKTGPSSSIPGALKPTSKALTNSTSAMENSPTVHPSPEDSSPCAAHLTINSLHDNDAPILPPSVKHFLGRASPPNR